MYAFLRVKAGRKEISSCF